MLTDTTLRSAVEALWDKLWSGGLEQFRLYYELLWLDAAHAVWLVVIPMICVASYCLLTTVARER